MASLKHIFFLGSGTVDFDNGSENYLKKIIYSKNVSSTKTRAFKVHKSLFSLLPKSTSNSRHLALYFLPCTLPQHCSSLLSLFFNIAPPFSHSFSHCPSFLALFLALPLPPLTLSRTVPPSSYSS